MTNINKISEAQLTAFALGELEGQEKQVVAEYVSQNIEAQKKVEEIQATSSWIVSELSKEKLSSPRLNLEIEKPSKITKTPFWKNKWILTPVFGSALAAGLAIVLITPQRTFEENVLVQQAPPQPWPQRGLDDGLRRMMKEETLSPGNAPGNVAMSETSGLSAGSKGVVSFRRSADSGAGSAAASDLMGANSVRGFSDAKRESGSWGGSGAYGHLAKKEIHGFQESTTSSESYDGAAESQFLFTKNNPLSTFSVDVDTASYANIRRFISGGQKVPKEAVRIEEMINYFQYDYSPPKDGKPFSIHIEQSEAPWKERHQIVKIGIKGKVLETQNRPASRLVFLIDVSGSMQDRNKLPLAKESLKILTESMTEKDQIAIVTYAGNAGVVLNPTSANNQSKIREALDRLGAGGSTNGGQGIEAAYQLAQNMFLKGGNNRVIIVSDGDFNVGITNQDDLIKLISKKAQSGIFLSVLGFGMGNYKDSTMEKLANKGNGNYAYIDQLSEAKKVFIQDLTGTLYTIAKDVKIQVDFNPAFVQSYRLIGYDNRRLANQDFADDTKDAGEIGAGHTVTAIYEVIPVGVPTSVVSKYQKNESEEKPTQSSFNGEMLTVNIRYKSPEGSRSELIEMPVNYRPGKIQDASADLKWAASVVNYGMFLAESQFRGTGDLNLSIDLAEQAMKTKRDDFRKEFLDLLNQSKNIYK